MSRSFHDELVRLFDLSPDPLCVAGFDGYLQLVNPAFVGVLGYPREELLARPFLDTVHPDDRASVGAALAALAAGADRVGFACRHVCADGSMRALEWNARGRPEDGLAYAVARDVTDRRLADAELGALRRLATRVGEGVPPEDLFAVVAEEVGRVFAAESTAVYRYDTDGAVTVGAWSGTGRPRAGAVGECVPLGGQNVATLVFETGQPVRLNRYPNGDSSPVTARARGLGVRSGLGAPISVEGRVWGALAAGCSGEGSLPAGTEQRLADFAELLATAIANTDARDELRRIADEQAGLRRVATLVACGVGPDVVFAAVAEEVAALCGADVTAIVRSEPDGDVTLVAGQGFTHFNPGARYTPGAHPTWEAQKTGRGARLDAEDAASADLPWEIRAEGIRSTVNAPITVDERIWGAIGVGLRRGRFPADTGQRLVDFTELVATAIATAQAHAELTASRARIVATADHTRRRIERDLHDGAQQRLVSLALQVRAAQAEVPDELGDVRAELDDIAVGLAASVDELRELARGIHPAILAQDGLRPALRTLARRSPIPVDLQMSPDRRLPERVEVSAYYVVAEALTNAAKHAQASAVTVAVDADDNVLRVSVRDDGVGGADLTRGTGLVGLKDRVEALGGRITVDSPRGSGTTLQVRLPLADPSG
jgi:PAS domain S-box-containing protein